MQYEYMDTMPPPGRHRRASRQLRALRYWRLAFAGCLLVPLVTAFVMVAQHGPAFFVFRSSGTGQSPDGAPDEDQGPGQPDAPRPLVAVRVVVKPAPRPSLAVRSPNSRLELPPGEPFAAIAELRGGTWAVVGAGATYGEAAAAARVTWTSALYLSQWVVVAVAP